MYDFNELCFPVPACARRFLPESIPWLVSKGRVAEAEATIQRAGRLNRIIPFPAHVFQVTEPETQSETKASNGKHVKPETTSKGLCVRIFRKTASTETKYTVVDLVRHRRLLLFTVVMCVLW